MFLCLATYEKEGETRTFALDWMLSMDRRVKASCSGWRGSLRKRAYYTGLTQRDDGVMDACYPRLFLQKPLCSLDDAIIVGKVL